MRPLEHVLDVRAPYDFDRTVRMRRFGSVDPTCRLEPGRLLKAWNSPQGPTTLEAHFSQGPGGGRLTCRLHGEGASWLLPRLEALFGVTQECPPAPAAAPPWLARAWREGAGLKLSRTPVVSDEHVAYVLQQRVEYRQAVGSHRALTEAYGQPAPGDLGLRLPLLPRTWAHIPSYAYAQAGVDAQRYRHVQVAVRAAARVDAAPDAEALRALLMSLPGTKSWTCESVLSMGYADSDAVPLGDVSLPHSVARAFTGRPHGSDEEMLSLLQPFRPHRARVLRLILG